MLELIVAPAAVQDLQEIGDFVAAKNPQAALRLSNQLREKAISLLERPFIGPKAGLRLFPDMRKLSSPPYLLFYRVTDLRVEIVRILHGARDVEAELSSSTPSAT